METLQVADAFDPGENFQEDPIAMIAKYPLMNAYWADKRAKAELINVPAYILASMSTGLHTVGSLRCFEDIPHDKKWSVSIPTIANRGMGWIGVANRIHILNRLRLNSTQEWHDLYQPEVIADIKKFLDFYTKGVKNNWEETPKARISVIRYNQVSKMPVSFLLQSHP